MENIVSTNLVFIDTSRGVTAGSKGDDHLINLSSAGITCGPGQYIRFTLDNFCMAKVFTDVNDNNNSFTVRADGLAALTENLSRQNFDSVRNLALDFQNKMGKTFKTMVYAGGTACDDFTAGACSPAAGTSINGTTDNIISFELTLTNGGSSINHGLGGTNPIIQFYSNVSDSYALLGGDRVIDESDITTSSVDIDVTNAQIIKVTCRYPAQRSTTPYIYLRTNLQNTNLESLGLAHPTEDYRNDTTTSDILGRVVVDAEWCQYTAQTGREFFMNVHQKNVSQLRLRLTDSHNRPLGRTLSSSHPLTATGSGSKQSTLGNLSFSAVLRVDVVQQRQVMELETRPYEPNFPARFSKVLTHQGFGKDNFGKAPGG